MLSSGKIDKYEYLTGRQILPSDQSRMTNFNYLIYYLKDDTGRKKLYDFKIGTKLFKKIKPYDMQLEDAKNQIALRSTRSCCYIVTLLNYLMIVLQLHPRLKIKRFMEKDVLQT